MFFVIDKPRLQRIIAIVRDDRTRKEQGTKGPFMRMEAREGTLSLSGLAVKATFPATVYEPGVLFLRITLFRKLLRAITGEKTLTIQVRSEGLLMANITMPLELNEMLLYTDPDKAPARCPLEEPVWPEDKPPGDTVKPYPPLPLFDGLDDPPEIDRKPKP